MGINTEQPVSDVVWAAAVREEHVRDSTEHCEMQ